MILQVCVFLSKSSRVMFLYDLKEKMILNTTSLCVINYVINLFKLCKFKKIQVCIGKFVEIHNRICINTRGKNLDLTVFLFIRF